MNKILLLIFIIASSLFVSGVTSKNITIENKCDYTVWPVSSARDRFSNNTNGFALEKGESRVIVNSFWSGAIWGRTLCSRNSTTGKFSCATGDCGSGEIECAEWDQAPVNTTLAEFQLNNDSVDLYRVNVVYGYNLPLLVVPQRMFLGIDKICSSVGCDVVNLNQACPYDLMVVDAEERPIACTNPCEAPDCMPSSYSEGFKVPCPQATLDFSDDNYMACTGSTDYLVTFCPSFTPIPTRRVKSETKIGTLGFTNKTTTGAKHDKKSPLKLKVILGMSTALLVMIVVVAASTVVMRAKNARKKSDWTGENIETIVMLKQYSYAKVKKMTNSFSHVLGKGGFGTVYKGKLPYGSGTDVAVKILKDSKGNGEEFINEVASMSRTSHVNIVSLLGFCYEGSKRAIIYEFMPNGSLDKYISESMSTKMEWETLYNIAEGVARGLEYLHNRCVSRIVHFDIKPQNILMDQDLCPKIADFGLAKLCKKKESIISMLNARGTIGYIAPEVFSKSLGGVSHKSDVYSYGMVVLEIVGAKNREMHEHSGSNNSSMYFPD
ncbi:unnamed protein product [Eruca vesicaria subsp. sativa]|uniref:non-specific serine/threonine protein kinase n=1 Tax=Eruca vesicaria subsp. sativa TaxID=29727 RepID=A0ABC8JHE4_ERUVS|nr:unnamed protein product [Eruca vesicaria subsp. sativa]